MRLKEIRTNKGLTQTEVANNLKISQQAYANYETGKRQPDQEMLAKIADYFDVSVDYLLGRTDTPKPSSSNSNTIKIPVLGHVAAGIPIDAIEEILDYEELDAQQFNPYCEYFGLKIKGDSMMPRIHNGDVVIVRKQPDIESGEVAIVCINGEEATCKQIQKHSNGITLISYNSIYEPMFFTNEEVMSKPITIIGKVIELRGKF